MRIDPVHRQTGRDAGEIVARVGRHEVFIRYHGSAETIGLADPFVIAALGKAMSGDAEGGIEVAAGYCVSRRLLHALPEHQRIVRTWWPSLSTVSVAGETSTRAVSPSGRTASFFSGGVDSYYTAVRNGGALTHLILCRGLDIPLHETARWQRTVEAAQRFADDSSLELVLVETNLKSELQTVEPDNHGAILIASALDLGFDRLLVPASDSPRMMMAWGSHPLTDPLFSSDSTDVVHDGVLPRVQKIQYLVHAGTPLDQLRVCNRFAEYNCGTCEKCLRTSVALEIYGTQVDSLPRFHVRHLDDVQLWTLVSTISWRDNLQAARDAGRRDIARAIERLLGRWERKEWLRKGDELFLEGRGYRFLRRLRSGFPS